MGCPTFSFDLHGKIASFITFNCQSTISIMVISVQVHWVGIIIIKINAFHFYNGFYNFLFQVVSFATLYGISNSAQIYAYMNVYILHVQRLANCIFKHYYVYKYSKVTRLPIGLKRAALSILRPLARPAVQLAISRPHARPRDCISNSQAVCQSVYCS